MYIGIKYEQRLKSVNKQLNSFGSALMFHGKTKYYFKNPIVALRVLKTLNSAIANAEVKELNVEKLFVKEIFVNPGAILKRFRARAKGSGNRILKRSSHLTVVVAEKE